MGPCDGTQLLEMLRRVLLVGIMVLVYRGSFVQLIIGAALCLLYLFLQMHVAPFKDPTDNYLANSCSFSLSAVFLCSIMFRIAELTERQVLLDQVPVEQQGDFYVPVVALSGVLCGCVIGALALSFAILLLQLARERKRLAHEARLRKLPTCDWVLSANHGYVCFLSHFKAEAGAEARYLKDSLDQMLGASVFLGT